MVKEGTDSGIQKDSQTKPKRDKPNIFISNVTYPNAESLFSFQLSPVDQIKDNCYVVIDTNALLVPYTVGRESLKEIESTYARTIEAQRLVIPGQVAREFVKNRAVKIGELYQQLSRKIDASVLPKLESYPLLDSMPEFGEALRISHDIENLTKQYRKQIATVLDRIKEWVWNDPVSLLYRKLFNSDVVFDPPINAENKAEIEDDLETRITYKIAPGYKDSSKADRGVGDLLIWRTILEIGRAQKKSVIFVSGEEKADWWYQTEKLHLYPRYELVDEFRRVSQDNSFHIVPFFRFLELFGASQEVVDEVRKEETQGRVVQSETTHIVYQPDIPLYADAQCLIPREGVWGVIIESRQKADDTPVGRHIFPSTRTHFKSGMRVLWGDWNFKRQWSESWYRDPDTNEIKYGWGSSPEFLGREIAEP